jgi:hypothetical protein
MKNKEKMTPLGIGVIFEGGGYFRRNTVDRGSRKTPLKRASKGKFCFSPPPPAGEGGFVI